MTLPADYHMHTPLCRHAIGDPPQYAARALEAGLQEIGFSDHNPMPEDGYDNWRMLASQLEAYVASVEETRRLHPRLSIKLALEVDFIPGYEDWVRELAAKYPWDYLIGSVHYVSPSWAIDNPEQIAEWKRHQPYEVWAAYFERLSAAAESRLFDIIGHADLCKKFCIYPERDPEPLFQRFLEAARKNSVAIELNTGGLRKDCKEIYPSSRIVRLAAQTGVPITFGSDSHAPSEVGHAFGAAVALARESGYTCWSRFDQRRRMDVRL